MSDKTAIEWCDHSASPWEGCTKISPGCANCYAAARDARHLHEPISHWGKGAPRRRVLSFESTAKSLDRKAAKEGVRRTIFPSVCDWLDDGVDLEWLADFLSVIHVTPNIDWLLLSKRPEKWLGRMRAIPLLPLPGNHMGSWDALAWSSGGTIPHNVWIGTSVEDQLRAPRIRRLLEIPAKVRFLSVEPLLGPVKQLGANVVTDNANVDDWPDDTDLAGRGNGFASARVRLKHPKGGDPSEWPEGLRVREFPPGKGEV